MTLILKKGLFRFTWASLFEIFLFTEAAFILMRRNFGRPRNINKVTEGYLFKIFSLQIPNSKTQIDFVKGLQVIVFPGWVYS
jgi:hypothetical protein